MSRNPVLRHLRENWPEYAGWVTVGGLYLITVLVISLLGNSR